MPVQLNNATVSGSLAVTSQADSLTFLVKGAAAQTTQDLFQIQKSDSTVFVQVGPTGNTLLQNGLTVRSLSGNADFAVRPASGNGYWDFAVDGTTGHFTMYDAVGGGVPLLIEKSSPTDSIHIQATTGRVGMGIASPAQRLDVRSSTGTSNARARLGCARVGEWDSLGGWAQFSNDALDQAPGTNYGLLHTDTGETYLNASTGLGIHMRIANVEKILLGATAIEGQVPYVSKDLLRVQGAVNVPANATGAGLELFALTGVGYVQTYDRTGAALIPMVLASSEVRLTQGPINMQSHQITTMADPTGTGDASTKQYTDVRPTIGGLQVFGHSWTTGNGVPGQASNRRDIIGTLAGLFGLGDADVLHFGAAGAKLTGSGGALFLNGLLNCSWATVLQGVVPPVSSKTVYSGQGVPTNDTADRASLFMWGVNDNVDDPTLWPTIGINAWKNALRTSISRCMARQLYLANPLDSTIVKTTGFATNVAGNDANSGAGVVRSTANADKLTITLPADFGGGTVAVCFIAQAGGGTTLSAAVTTTGATSISATLAGSTLPASGTVVIKIDSEEMLVTAGLGTGTLTVTRGVNGTTAATHLINASITVAQDTHRITVSGTASAATGTIQLGGQGQANTKCPVVLRMACIPSDRNKTIILTVAGIVASDTSATVDFDSWWIEASYAPPPIAVCNTPRYPAYFGHAVVDITTTWPTLNGATNTVVAEFPNNVFVEDLDSLFYAQTMLLEGGATNGHASSITAADTTIYGNLQAFSVGPAVGDRIRIDTEDMLVTAITGSANPYTLTVVRGINSTTPATHANAAWIAGAAYLFTDNLHPNQYGSSRIAQKTYEDFRTRMSSWNGTTPAAASSRFTRVREKPAMPLVDTSYVTCEVGSVASVVTTINTPYAHPVYIPERCIVTAAGAWVVTGQASTTIRIGLYSCDVSGTRPGSLIADWGTVATTGTGVWTEISGLWQILEPGYYWAVSVTQGGTTQPNMSCVNNLIFPVVPWFMGVPNNNVFHGLSYGTGTTSGALPATYVLTGAVNAAFGQVPRIALKVRAHHWG